MATADLPSFWFLVPAAGKGTRFGNEVPKQYHRLRGHSVLAWTLMRLASHPCTRGLIVALAPDDQYWPGLTRLLDKPVITCTGGTSRAESVFSCLLSLPQKAGLNPWVLVHDAARPCVPHSDIHKLIERGTQHAVGALLAVPIQDTLKQVAHQEAIATVNRENIWRSVTPQLFRADELKTLINQIKNDGLLTTATDESSIFERYGKNPLVVHGCAENIKITLPDDVRLAEFLLGAQTDFDVRLMEDWLSAQKTNGDQNAIPFF